MDEDKNGFIWVSTFKGGIAKIDPKSDKVTRFKIINPDLNALALNFGINIKTRPSVVFSNFCFLKGVNSK